MKKAKSKTYKIRIAVPVKTKNIKIKMAMAKMYASSPYLTKRKKDKMILDLFKARKVK